MSNTATELSIADRVARLREAMGARALDAYVIPSPDPHQSEYVPGPWQRRGWISGYDGSAGTVVVLRERALVWADSRYWLQAEAQLEGTPYDLMRLGRPDVKQPADWLEANLGVGQRVGVDPQVFTLKEWRAWVEKLERGGSSLVAVEENLIDDIWEGRPQLPAAPVFELAEELTGSSVAHKLAELRSEMASVRCDAHVITTLDSIAWLYNIRGSDVAHNPVAISYAVVTADRATLFIDPDKPTPGAKASLQGLVDIRPYDDFATELGELATRGARVWIDPATVSRWVVDRLSAGGSLYEKQSPIVGAKAVKNAVELEGMRRCHVRDGVAVTRFLSWLEREVASGASHDEISVADRLAAFRAEGEHFQGLSFRTISGYGPNGAIVHYTVTPATSRRIEPHGIYLVDSGGQYLDGTTDITRTVTLGEPTAEQKDRFTRVLQGHIGIATARFPKGSTGSQLDTLARKPLWDAGLNYGHGTGHGVGHFLCVHEGPAGIAPGSTSASLEVGMVLSNEPGYYQAGEYGIRIENLVEVVEGEAGPDGTSFLGFADLTMVPIDKRLVEASMLTPAQREWLDGYHATVREKILPHLTEAQDRAWLEQATAAL